MVQAFVIAVFVVVLAGGATGGEGVVGAPWWRVVGSLVPYVGIWGVMTLGCRASVRRLDRTGNPRAIGTAERIVLGGRIAAIVWHGVAVFGLGELDGVRAIVGDWVAVDELMVVAAPLAVIAAGFALMDPFERRVRDAVLLRRLDAGETIVMPAKSRGTLSLGVRHHILFVGIPLAVIMAWGECVDRAWAYFGWSGREWLGAGAQLAGALTVFVLTPAVMRRVWHTFPLPAGELRERLCELGTRHKVRFRDLLVWDTGGVQTNGAVMGLVGRLRYVLLTDALLERLREREVEAVMAHEVGHVRRHHMVWLGVSVLATVMVVGTPLGWGVGIAATAFGLGQGAVTAADTASLVLTLVAALSVLGFVSRRFEWQADAFALQHLSGWTEHERGVAITPESAQAMGGALLRVAHLNGIDTGKFTWRHGSIGTRLRKLRGAVGRPADRLRADRDARAVKWAALAAFVVGAGLTAVEIGVGLLAR